MSMTLRFKQAVSRIKSREIEFCACDNNQWGLDVKGRILYKDEMEAFFMAYALTEDEAMMMQKEIDSLGKLYSYSWQDAHVYHCLEFTIDIAVSKQFTNKQKDTLF